MQNLDLANDKWVNIHLSLPQKAMKGDYLNVSLS